jgi:hypothetical protein
MYFNWKIDKSRKKKEETIISDRLPDHHRYAPHLKEEHVTTLLMTRRNAIF